MSTLKTLIPNFLTGARILSVGLICWIVLGEMKIGFLSFWQMAGLILLFALMTDLIDGLLARRLKATTLFGYYFDHIVDFILMALIIYFAFLLFNPYLAFLLLFSEIYVVFIAFLRIILKEKKTRWPNIWGKMSFGFIGVSLCIMLLLKEYFIFVFLANFVLGVGLTLRWFSFFVWHKELLT